MHPSVLKFELVEVQVQKWRTKAEDGGEDKQETCLELSPFYLETLPKVART